MPEELIWIAEARKYLGMNEFDNKVELTALFDFVDMKQDGKYPGNADPEDQPWCAQFISAVLAKCGIKPSDQTWWARSYRHWGRSLFGPVYGAVAVVERGPVYGHVGFVVGKTDRSTQSPLWILGGNQDNMVKLSLFPRKRFITFRYPVGFSLPTFLLPVFGQAEEFSEKEI